MTEHMRRPLVGKERSQWRTQKSNDFYLFVPFCHRSLLDRLVSHPKASRKVQHIFLYDQRLKFLLCPASCSCVFIELSSLQRHALCFAL